MKPNLHSSTLSVEQARAVAWPFRDFKGQPIGVLLDQNLITLKDLGFAVQHAYNKSVRDASRIILLDVLGNEVSQESSRGPLNLVSSDRRSFAERRQLQLFMMQGAVIGVLIGIAVAVLIAELFANPRLSAQSGETQALLSQPGIVVGVLVFMLCVLGLLVGSLWILDRLIDLLNKQVGLHRKGQLGEERVLNILYQVLDNRWWVFRNMEIPGQRSGDIDFVLVGPGGIWLLEVKAWEGKYRTVGDRWERQVGTSWLPALKNPSTQAKRNAAKVSQLLKIQDIAQWVQPVVIWANPKAHLTVEVPSTHVWQLTEVSEELVKHTHDSSMPEQRVADVVGMFKRLYETQSLSTYSGETSE